MAKKQATKAQRKPHVVKLEQVRNLQQTARHNVYDRVTLLVEVFEDVDWREEQHARGVATSDNALVPILDQYVEDTQHDFLELRDVLRHFPDKKDWESRPLSRMLQEVRGAARDTQAASVSRPSYKSKAEDLERELDLARMRIHELEGENQELRRRLVSQGMAVEVAA